MPERPPSGGGLPEPAGDGGHPHPPAARWSGYAGLSLRRAPHLAGAAALVSSLDRGGSAADLAYSEPTDPTDRLAATGVSARRSPGPPGSDLTPTSREAAPRSATAVDGDWVDLTDVTAPVRWRAPGSSLPAGAVADPEPTEATAPRAGPLADTAAFAGDSTVDRTDSSWIPTFAPRAAPPPAADRAVRASALVGLLFAAALLFRHADPVDARVVHLVDAPAPGWYEADDLAAAARAAGAPPARLASAAVVDGDTVRLVDGWALPEHALTAATTRVFGGRLSVNDATADELVDLPGIGPALAARIVAGRPYRTVADLDRVRGIGSVKLAALAPLVRP
jgi:DNA uptake protein ComE-like DNA-binding protein